MKKELKDYKENYPEEKKVVIIIVKQKISYQGYI